MTSSEEGPTGTPFEMTIELGKIREFAAATKSKSPHEYLDRNDPVSPATFLVTSTFWQDPNSQAAGAGFTGYERILHGAQEFIFFGEPPRVGTVLTVQSTPGRAYEKTGRPGGAMKFRELVSEYRDQPGTLVAESRGTVMETSQAPTGGPAT
jgi:N-terminal half of MaoC dehydratase